MRIVSLVPSMTETLLGWGVTPVACTRFCEQPGLPHVGGTKDPDVDAIAAIAPDLVIVDTEENRLEDHDRLVALGIPVHAVSIRGIEDLVPQLGAVADRIGVAPFTFPELGRPPARLRAFVPIWRRPWMALGAPTYGSSLLAALGVDNVYAGDGGYPETTIDDAARRHPDVVLAPSEPYPFTERQRPELAAVAPVIFVDGHDLFWWGVRTAAAVDRLRAVLSEHYNS